MYFFIQDYQHQLVLCVTEKILLSSGFNEVLVDQRSFSDVENILRVGQEHKYSSVNYTKTATAAMT